MRLRLISKLAISTSAVLLIGMACFAFINVEHLKKTLMEETVSDTDKLSETIIRTTHYQMMENDTIRVYQMMNEVGSQKGIERIRLISKNGRIIFSTAQEEVGVLLDSKAEGCNSCHSAEGTSIETSSMNRSRTFTNREGKNVLGLARAIYNEEGCYIAACHFHSPNSKVLGVLDIIVSLEPMQNRIAAYRKVVVILTAVQVALIFFCLTFLTQKMVNLPLRQILHHTQRLGRGELEAYLEIQSRDEMGELSDACNDMTLKLKTARDQLEEWGKVLEAKVEERTGEVKAIQAQLVRSEKLASLGELVAGIAHEINNPLTGILMFASMSSKDPKLDPGIRDDLEIITRETQRCAKIVKGLLDFSRESIPQKQPSSINKIMEATLSLVENQSTFHNIDVEKRYDQEIPEVLADPNQIEQVFVNILLNANHAMCGGGTLRISTWMDNLRQNACIAIGDTGSGIPEENLSRIFDPFFTTKENKGTGLGLSVSYGIIESHGGMIEVESKVGVGTTFTVKLPLLAEGAAICKGIEGQLPN